MGGGGCRHGQASATKNKTLERERTRKPEARLSAARRKGFVDEGSGTWIVARATEKEKPSVESFRGRSRERCRKRRTGPLRRAWCIRDGHDTHRPKRQKERKHYVREKRYTRPTAYGPMGQGVGTLAN